MSETHPEGLAPLPPVGPGADQHSEDVNKEGFAEDELLYEVDAVLDPIMALEMFCRSTVPAHRLAYAASIGAAAGEAAPHVVDGTLVPLLKELYSDSYADIRGVALGQTAATAKVLAGAGPLYLPRLEALWSCLEGLLLDGDLENQELAAAAVADLAHLQAPGDPQGVAQRLCSTVDRLTHVKPSLVDEGLIQAMRLVTQVLRARPGSPLGYEAMGHFIAPLFLDQVLKASEVVREAATAFVPELLAPLTHAQRQELLLPLAGALVKDKFWNVRAAAAVMLANLLEVVKDLDDKERLKIRKYLSQLCSDTSPRVEVSAFMVLGIALPLLPREEALSDHPPLLKEFAFAADVPPVLQTAAIDPVLVPGSVHASASAAAVEVELAAGVGATTAEHDMSGKVAFAGWTRSTTAAAAAAAGGKGSTGAVWLPRCVAHYLPQVVSHLGAASWHRLGPAWRDLVTSKDVVVLHSLVAGTPALAAALGQKLTQKDLLPPVISLINEQLEVVAPVVAQHAAALLRVLPRAQQLRLLQLLPALVVQAGGGEARNWRSRVHIAQQLASMAALLAPHQVGYRLWPLLLTLCKDPVHAVRAAAAAQAGGVLQHIPAAAGSKGIHTATSVSPYVTSGDAEVAGDQDDVPKAAAADAACVDASSGDGKEQPKPVSPKDHAAGDTSVPSDQRSTAGDTAGFIHSSSTGGGAMAASTAAVGVAGPGLAAVQPGATAAAAAAGPQQSDTAAAPALISEQQAEAADPASAAEDTAAGAASALSTLHSSASVGDGDNPTTTAAAVEVAAGHSSGATRINSNTSTSSSGSAAAPSCTVVGRGWWNHLVATGLGLGSHLLEQAAWHYQHYVQDASHSHHPHQPSQPRLVPLGTEDPSLVANLPLPTVQLLLGDLVSMLQSSHANTRTQEASDRVGGSSSSRSSSSSKGWQQRQVCVLALGSVLAVAVTGGQAAAVAATVAGDEVAAVGAVALAAADELLPNPVNGQGRGSANSAGGCQAATGASAPCRYPESLGSTPHPGPAAAAAAAAAVDKLSQHMGQLDVHTDNCSQGSSAAAAAADAEGAQQPEGCSDVAGYGIAAAPVALLQLLNLLLQLSSDPVPGVRVTLVRVLLHLRQLLTAAAAPHVTTTSTSSTTPAPTQAAAGTPGEGCAAAGDHPGSPNEVTMAAAPAAAGSGAHLLHPLPAAAPLLKGQPAAAVLAAVEECLQTLQGDACCTVAELAGRPCPPHQSHGLVLQEAHLY